MKPLFIAPNTLELQKTMGQAQVLQPEVAWEPAGCPPLSAPANRIETVLFRKEGSPSYHERINR